MTFNLKNYQERVLSRLDEYLRLARLQGAAAAYEAVANREDDKGGKENPYASPAYHQTIEGLDDCPHVCLRIPTGGGKTYLAARSLKHAAVYMENKRPTVLWFVPSEAIRAQTEDVLKNREHPCRKALEDCFGYGVKVYNIEDFDATRPQDFESNASVIVTTAQMFRVRKTAKKGDDGMSAATRRIYEHHEMLQPHFERFMPGAAPKGLERDENGEVKYSFANLLHLRRPLVVLDEAHNFISDLSQEVLRRVNPKCVLEWTATPRQKDNKPLHNVLASATASELYAEEMLKMPISLTEHRNWKAAVNGAVGQRKKLAEVAKKSGDAARPIVLYQAESKQQGKERITPEVLRKHLMEEEGVDESAVAVHTGDKKEIESVDLFAPDCPIEHIITVQALREGWDCSYAYVLCSVANMQSAVAVEQLMGRVMRMPQARRRKHDDLNGSYVHAPVDNAYEAVELMRNKIALELGFEDSEVEYFVQESFSGEWEGGEDGGLLDEANRTFEVSQKPSFEGLSATAREEAKAAVEVRPNDENGKDGGCKVILKKPVGGEVSEAIAKVFVAKTKSRDTQRLQRVNRRLSAPANRGVTFAALPQLFFDFPDEGVIPIDADSLHAVADWDGIGDNCLIDNFSITETAQTFVISLEGGAVSYTKSGEFETPLLDSDISDEKLLVGWLEREIRNPDGRYVPEALRKYINANIAALKEKEHTTEQLLRAKYQLAEALKRRIVTHEEKVDKETARKYLFDNAKAECRFLFTFPAKGYNPAKIEKGTYIFKRHFYGVVGELNAPERRCAMALDGNDDIRHWVRNIPKSATSYGIPYGLSDNYYPDFVAQLTGGEVLIVEYKGAFLKPTDKTKLEAGELLEEKSGGKCYFLTVTEEKGNAPVGDQIKTKIREIQERARR